MNKNRGFFSALNSTFWVSLIAFYVTEHSGHAHDLSMPHWSGARPQRATRTTHTRRRTLFAHPYESVQLSRERSARQAGGLGQSTTTLFALYSITKIK
jgi:hypothetical protein